MIGNSPNGYGIWRTGGAAALVGCLIVWQTDDPGYVYQTEFSPDTLAFRSNNYWFCPFFSTPHEWTMPVLEQIKAFDDGKIQLSSPPRWRFVHGHKSGTRGWHGDAKNIYRALRSSEWITWTDEHPELAKRLWPKIIHLIRREEYYQVRAVLMYARDAKPVEELDHAFIEGASND